MAHTESQRSLIAARLEAADDWLLGLGRRLGLFLHEYRYLLAVLLVGFVVWTVVFNIAVVDYLNTSTWNHRSAWLGPVGTPAPVEIFGYTIYYQFEGYSDYSFYYVHWGYNFLNGVMPYSDAFGYLDMNGVINQNGAYMFPPLTAYLYAAGIYLGNLLGIDNWGIGFLIAAFGYLTVLPTYGIARELSGNPRVGEIAALTYLLSPLVIFHIDFIWLNPSPFYFFFFAGFYALVKNRRHTGTVLIVTAALFKQTAWFLGIPLVVYLLMKKRPQEKCEEPEFGEPIETPQEERPRRSLWATFVDLVSEYIDFRGFIISVVVVLAFVGAVMLPFLVAQPWFWNYWRLAMGSFSFEGNFEDPPLYGVPMRLAVLAIMYGQPAVAEIIDTMVSSGAPLVFGITLASGAMLLAEKRAGSERTYMRHILFLTLLLMLWVNLVGPRGSFKYYFTMFGPFFSIFASSRMTSQREDFVPVSASMAWAPLLCALAIFIPGRNFYLAYVVVIFACYLIAPWLGGAYSILKRPYVRTKRLVSEKVGLRYSPLVPVLSPTSRKAAVLDIVIRLSSSALGVLFIWYGLVQGFSSVGGTTLEVLRALILSSILLLIGPQLAVLPFRVVVPEAQRESAARTSMNILSGTLAAVLLMFGAATYTLSWDIEIFFGV